MINILGPADPDEPIVEVPDEQVMVSSVGPGGLLFRVREHDGTWSDEQEPTVDESVSLDGVVLARMRLTRKPGNAKGAPDGTPSPST